MHREPDQWRVGRRPFGRAQTAPGGLDGDRDGDRHRRRRRHRHRYRYRYSLYIFIYRYGVGVDFGMGIRIGIECGSHSEPSRQVGGHAFGPCAVCGAMERGKAIWVGIRQCRQVKGHVQRERGEGGAGPFQLEAGAKGGV